MLIQCTKKLLDELGIEPSAAVDRNPLFSWHANLVKINRRKTLVLVHDRSRYVIVLYGLKKKDFQKLDSLILSGIRDAFQTECIDKEITNSFLEQSGEITYTKATDRSSLGRLVKAALNLERYADRVVEDSILQGLLSRKLSRFFIKEKGKAGYIWPFKELYKDLEGLYGRPAQKCRAAVLKVTLELEGFEVWRRILVPLNTSFTTLHWVIQTAFGWQDYHLHEFIIFGEQGPVDEDYINHPAFHHQGYKPVLRLESYDDGEDYGDSLQIPKRMEEGAKLSDLDFKHAKYIYDFGDFWRHYLDVEEIIEDHNGNSPIFIDGYGDAPPEDVGGESGFEQFTNAMADVDDPEHLEWKLWSEGQGYKKYDATEIKRTFSWMFR